MVKHQLEITQTHVNKIEKDHVDMCVYVYVHVFACVYVYIHQD